MDLLCCHENWGMALEQGILEPWSTSCSAGDSCYDLVSRLLVTGLWLGIQGLRGDIWVLFLLTWVLEAECDPEGSCDTNCRRGDGKANSCPKPRWV